MFRVPFPELGLDLVDGHFASLVESSSEIRLIELNSWEENWFFKQKRRTKQQSADRHSVLESVRMFIPNPCQEAVTLVGEEDVEELQDLSERNSVASLSFSDSDSDSESERNDMKSCSNELNALPPFVSIMKERQRMESDDYSNDALLLAESERDKEEEEYFSSTDEMPSLLTCPSGSGSLVEEERETDRDGSRSGGRGLSPSVRQLVRRFSRRDSARTQSSTFQSCGNIYDECHGKGVVPKIHVPDMCPATGFVFTTWSLRSDSIGSGRNSSCQSESGSRISSTESHEMDSRDRVSVRQFL